MAEAGSRARGFVVGIVLGGIVVACPIAQAACGDAILDPGEQCDHGAANGEDACCSATCQVVDFDGDGQCNGIDACANG